MSITFPQHFQVLMSKYVHKKIKPQNPGTEKSEMPVLKTKDQIADIRLRSYSEHFASFKLADQFLL